ncbi:hypothetical protein [Halobiforma nitratireducens]|uniref:Uncharacterized protein n=1 Tax=Halobiforma nitratireducens JCM 10879 TaxID=1227454 RepID=M0LHT4_9EURY|nr:hypothetical protein [Halobiforma nitratireducens]EMA33192.1 hypothetical protein C446_14399 [Halobiforma nitratireducens JCM 10879]
MERRKILLGSGAALATALAGCSSTETGDEDPDDGDDGYDDDDGGYDDDGYDDDDDDDDDDDHDEVPGFDDDLEADSDVMSIMDIDRDDDRLYVVTQTDTTDPDVLSKELETVGYDIAAAVSDTDHFKAEISEIEWVLEHDDNHVLAVFIDVQWVVDFIEDELTDDEFVKKVLESKDQ